MNQIKTSPISRGAKNKASNGKWRTFSLFSILLFCLIMGGGYLVYNIDKESPMAFYFNLANPYLKYVVINPGMRMEEVSNKVSKSIGWTEEEKREFINSAPQDDNGPMEGFFMPGAYWLHIDASGKDVADQMLNEFNSKVGEKILSDLRNKNSEKINLETAVRIASIIQREAAGPNDMRLISGVIWNRLFKGMTLGMDATLQYAKGNDDNWWPRVLSSDKKIESPYNTYSNMGLPPTAISNVSIDALKAAYNPQKTDCMYYLHDSKRRIHCSKTYTQHKNNIQTYLIGSRDTKRKTQ